MTRPRDSCPSTRRALPGGAQPYFPSTISTSVPHTPTAMACTTTDPPRVSGSGMSSRCAVSGLCGSTVIAFTSTLFLCLLCRVRARHADPDRVQTGACGDEQRAPVLAAEAEVRRPPLVGDLAVIDPPPRAVECHHAIARQV